MPLKLNKLDKLDNGTLVTKGLLLGLKTWTFFDNFKTTSLMADTFWQ